MAKTRLQQDVLKGPDGSVVKVNWMPGGRLRLDFVGSGPVLVSSVFSDPKTSTSRLECRYGR